MKHARMICFWEASRTIRDVLCTPNRQFGAFCFGRPPLCSYRELLGGCASWDSVCVSGERHVAAVQGRAP